MSKKSVIQGICDILSNEYDRLNKKYPDASYRDIINKMPSINEVLDEILVYYDKSAVINFFDSDDLLNEVSSWDIIDKAKETSQWDNELDDAVEAEINSRDLMTWKECDDAIEAALAERPKTYKDMSPDELWEHMHDLLDISYGDIDGADPAFDDLLNKMAKSSYAYEYFDKNKVKK